MDVARYLFRMLAQIGNLPMIGPNLPALEDEEDWEDGYPGENGSLEKMIVADADIVRYHPRDLDTEGDIEKELPSETLKLGSVIAQFSGCKLELPFSFRKSHVKAFRELGYSERRSRDFAVMIATMQMMHRQEFADYDRSPHEPFGDGNDQTQIQPSSGAEEIDAAVKDALRQRDEAFQRRKSAEVESQKLRHDIAVLRREKEQLEDNLKRSQELLELHEQMASQEEERDEETAPDIVFPYETDKRIVLYGGFHSFHQDLQKLIPSIRIVPHASHLDMTPFRKADVVFLQINKTSHSNYWNVCDTAKNYGVPFYHLNYAGPRRCAMEIVRQIQALEEKE